MNARWTINEEKQLVTDIAQSKSYQELAQKYNRSPNALELRVKKIVYDNVINNRTPEMIGGSLNLPVDKIKQYYYSYKEMLEKRGKPVTNVDFNNKVINGGNNKLENNNKIINKTTTENNNKNNINLTGGEVKIKDDRLVNIIDQNETFKEIINNVKMRKKLRKLLKSGKLSPEIKDLLKDILED
jgi:hypothetical protein